MPGRGSGTVGAGGGNGGRQDVVPESLHDDDDDDEVEQEELEAFAVHLGMDPIKEHDLMWICRMALKAPVPEGWTAHEDGDGNTYFYNDAKGISSWEHPSDEFFRTLYRRCKAVQGQVSSSSQASSAADMANKELQGQLDLLKKKHAELKVSADRVLLENDELARRVSEGKHDLDEQRQRHIAEIEALKSLNLKSGSQAAEVPRLEKEVSEMMTQLKVAEAELQRYKQGVSQVGNQTDKLVEELQKELARDREEAKLIRAELDAALGRADELETRVSNLQAVSLSDKQQVAQLRVGLEEAARERDALITKTSSEASSLDAQLSRVMKQSLVDIKAAEEKSSVLQKALDDAQRDKSELKRKLDDAVATVEKSRAELAKALAGGSRADHDSSELREALDSARSQVASLSHQLDNLEKANLEIANSESAQAVKLQRAEALLEEAHTAAKQADAKAAKDREDILALRKEVESATGMAKESLARASQLEVTKTGIQQDLQASLKQVKERELKLQIESEGLKEELIKLRSQVDSAASRAQDAEAALADSRLMYAQLKERSDRQEEQLLHAREASAKVSASLQNAMGGSHDSDDVGQTISALLSQIEFLKTEMANAEEKMQEISRTKVAAEEALSQAQGKHKAVSEEKARLEASLIQQGSSLAVEREARMRAQADLQIERQDAHQKIGSLKSSLQEAKREAESHASSYAASQAVVRSLERRVKEQQEMQKETTDKNSKLREDVDSLRLAKAKSEAESRRIVLSFSHEIREYQSQLESDRLEKKELRGRLSAGNVSGQEVAQELVRKLEKSRAECEAERKKREKVEMELDEAKSEVQESRAQYEQLCDGFEDLKKRHADAYERQVDAERRCAVATSQSTELSDRNKRLTAYISEDGEYLREQIQTLEAELSRLGRERQDLARRLGAATARAEGAEKNAQDTQRDRERMRLQIERLKGSQLDPRSLSWGASEIRAKTSAASDNVLEMENQEMLTVVSELREALRATGPKLREMEVANNQLQSEADVTKAQSEAAKTYWQNQLRQRAAELTSKEETIEQLSSEIAQVRRDADRFRTSNETLQGRIQELQASVDRLSQAKGSNNAGFQSGPAMAAGRGVMGLRMRTPTAAPYTGFHQYTQPPLPRAGNPVRPKSKIGQSSSRMSMSSRMSTAAVPAQFQAASADRMATAVTGLPTPYAAAPRPRTSSKPFAPPSLSQPGPPVSLLSPVVMENLLGLRPPGTVDPNTPTANATHDKAPTSQGGTSSHSSVREAGKKHVFSSAYIFSIPCASNLLPPHYPTDFGPESTSGSLLREYDR
jgi:chromosome segregation ATPase